MRRTTTAICALLLLIAACVASEPEAPSPGKTTAATSSVPATVTPAAASASLAGVTVTGSAEGAPEGCTVETVAERLVALAAAVNNADPNVVPAFFGTSDATFEWYCMHDAGESFTATSLDELDAYFRRRYEQHERWTLQSVQVNGWARGVLHFGPVVISHTADDFASTFEALGKGAYSCEREQFVVLCLGEATE